MTPSVERQAALLLMSLLVSTTSPRLNFATPSLWGGSLSAPVKVSAVDACSETNLCTTNMSNAGLLRVWLHGVTGEAMHLLVPCHCAV